jgi:hypothetical protein
VPKYFKKILFCEVMTTKGPKPENLKKKIFSPCGRDTCQLPNQYLEKHLWSANQGAPNPKFVQQCLSGL